MRYILKKARRVTINDIATGKHRATIEELKSVNLTDGQDTTWATGANGMRLAGFDQNKTSTFTFQSGLISTGVIEAQVGGEKVTVTNGNGIKMTETLPITSSQTTVVLAHKATGEAGNEVKWIYKVDTTGDPGKAFAQAAVASATEFAYDAETKTITLPTGAFAAGDDVYVEYFPTFSSYEEIVNDAESFGLTGEVYVDAWWTDTCTQTDVPLQMYCPAGKVSGAFSLAFGDEVAVQEVTIEAVTRQCAGQKKIMWVLRSYDTGNIVDA